MIFAINSERCGLPTATLMLFTVSLCVLFILARITMAKVAVVGDGSECCLHARVSHCASTTQLRTCPKCKIPLLEQAKEARLIVTASPGGSRARNLTAGHVID